MTTRSIKKAFLPGAGLGTRLLPLTRFLPKPLVPFYHEPLICQTLRRCAEAGIEEVMINTHHLPDRWDIFFPNHEWGGLKLFFSHEPVLLDTGGGIKKIEEWLGNEPFLVCNADNLTDFPLSRLIESHLRSQAGATLVLRKEGYNTNVALDSSTGNVADMRHHLGIHPGTHQFTGMYCLEPEVLSLIPADVPVSIVEALYTLISRQSVKGLEYNEGFWIDLGTEEVYLDAHKRVQGMKIHPEACIEEGARLDSLCIAGPGARIPGDAVLKDCIVWPDAAVPPGTHAYRKVFTE